MTTQHETLVAEYLDLKERGAAIRERQDAILTELRTLGLGKHRIGSASVSISPNRRFSADLAAEVVHPDVLSLCTETVITSTKAKAVLPPALYDRCMAEVGQPRVSIL